MISLSCSTAALQIWSLMISTFAQNYTMNYWVEKGADKKKLIMGMPMYGQAFTMNSPSPSGLAAPAGKGIAGEFTRQEGFTAYYEVSNKQDYRH